MSEPRRPSLFDLPLEPPEERRDPPRPEEPRPRRRGADEPSTERAAKRKMSPRRPEAGLPLFPDEDDAASSPEAAGHRKAAREPDPPPKRPVREEPSPNPPPAVEPRPAPVPAPLGARWKAGSLDLLLHAALGLALAFGSSLLGAPLEGFEMLGLAVFVAVFSFLYTVIPLAFWGRTLGMTRAGLVASGGDREQSALTFGQTALRWLGELLTLALLGLPTLLALLGGRSLTDRLSGSRTWRLPRSGNR